MTTGLQSLKDTFVKRAKGGSIRRFSLSMSAAVLGRLSLLALSILVARSLGATDYGAFTFATGLALVLGQFAGLGWPTLMNRLIPGFKKDGDWSSMRGLLRAGPAIILTTSLVFSSLLVIVSYRVGELRLSFILSALLTPPFAFCILRRQQLAALKKAHFGMLLDQGFGALVTVGLLLILGGLTLGETVVAYAIATLGGTMIGASLVRKFSPVEVFAAKATYRLAPWMATAFPIMIGLSAKLLLGKTDVLLLAPLAGLEASGIYGAAWRLTYILTFPQVVLMTLVTPALSEAFTSGQAARARRIVFLSLGFTTLTTAPFIVAFFVFGPQIIGLIFGPGFENATVPLQILSLGQLAVSFSMVFASVLMMGGRERLFAGWNVILLAINIAACLILIPSLGPIGAAIAMAGTAGLLLLGQAALAWQLVLRRPIGQLKAQYNVE